MLEGRRIVLGVSGGIAAYKAVEVCRRLVDAGAHVVPVLTDGALRFVGRTTFDALASEPAHVALGRPPPDPAHPPRPDGRPRARRAGDGPGPRPLRRRHQRRPAHQRPARHPGAGPRVPGHAHRDVGAPGGAGQPRDPAARGVHVVEPEVGRLAGGDVGAGRLADPETIVEAVDGLLAPTRARPRRAQGPRHRRRHPRADRPGALHRQPLVGQAGPRRRRRGRRPRRQGHPRHHRRPAGRRRRRGRAGRHRGRDGARRAGPGRRRRRRRDGRCRRRLPARRRCRPARSRRRPVSPRSCSSRPPTSSPRSAPASVPARPSSASRPRPTTSCQRRRQARAQGGRPHRRQRRLGPAASASSTTPTRW